MTDICDCNKPNDIGRNNPCFDCGKPIEGCISVNTVGRCIKTRNHDGKHLVEVEW
jgi:hypothetical protein